MSSTINASTASGGGVVTTADASGILQLQTAGTTALTIDASQNVGVGTSSPSAKLHFIVNSTIGQAMFLYNGTSANYIDADLQAFRSGNGTERMRLDASGNLLMGTTSNTVNNSNSFVYRQDLGAEILNHINGTVTGSQYIYFGYNGSVIGSVTQNLTTGVLYNTSSDKRLKENIVDAPSALASVNAIKVRSFDFISDGIHVDYGYIAQELLKVAPEAVSVPENEDEMMGVDFGKLTPRLVKSIQELKAIIDTQTARIEALEAKI